MEPKRFFKKLLVNASVYFTLITAAYALITVFIHVGEERVLLSAVQMLYNFLFALLAAVAWNLYRMPQWSGALRLLLHYGILILAFYACFLFPASMRSAQIIIGIVLFTVLYALLMLIAHAFIAKLRANAQKEVPYEKQFQKKS